MSREAIRFEGATRRLDGFEAAFDLSVEAGAWLGIIGPSGAGKSTLLDIAAGFSALDAGRVAMFGADMAGIAPADRPLAMVFQENNLFPGLDAFRNAALGLTPRLRLSAAERAEVAAMLERVGLGDKAGRRPHELSGGERGRVALARAFLSRRPILALDEPFAALGPALRAEMLALLAELRRSGAGEGTPRTILMVTHHPEDAAAHADRIAFVENGRVALEGPAHTLLSQRNDARLDRYLGPGRGET